MRLTPVRFTNLLSWAPYVEMLTSKLGVRSRKAKWTCVYWDVLSCVISIVRHGRSRLKASK